jgi:hypothetical protein
LKVNPRTYPYGKPSIFETKTGKQISLLRFNKRFSGEYYYEIGYFDESQPGGIYRVDRNKYDWDSVKEISKEYYEELKRDIDKFDKENPSYDLILAYSFY